MVFYGGVEIGNTTSNLKKSDIGSCGMNFPSGNYMFKVNNRNPRARYETFSKLAIKTLERHLVLLLTLNIFNTLF